MLSHNLSSHRALKGIAPVQTGKLCRLLISTAPPPCSPTQVLHVYSNAASYGVARSPWQRINIVLTLHEGASSALRCRGLWTSAR